MSPTVTPPPLEAVIPKPALIAPAGGLFTLSRDTRIVVTPARGEARRVAVYLADLLNRSTGYGIPVEGAKAPPRAGDVVLRIADRRGLGAEGYELQVTPEQVTLVARRPAGLFHGVQTIRQLLPPAVERTGAQPGPWQLLTGTIRDSPRFTWRGAMLDVARHFFAVEDVKRFIDLLALYKLNRLHLHLTDDQGWRLAIRSWPRLTTHGGSTQVGGGRGGFYTAADYRSLVAYAASRYVTVVPEIDMPGHTNAALASYPELTCDGVAPPLYTGIEVGFSSLCPTKERTYEFVADVVREVAALTPGPYLHIGGDEAKATKPTEYLTFLGRMARIVRASGKRLVGWEEIGRGQLRPGTIVQHWHDERVTVRAVRQGAKLVMSPATKAYLDMKYEPSSRLGLQWAGTTDVRDAYDWDPATQIRGVSERQVLGVEAPLWSETLRTMRDVEHMAFPRLLGIAEIGWARAEGRSWDEYRERLGAHAPRLRALGVNFYRAPAVPWR